MGGKRRRRGRGRGRLGRKGKYWERKVGSEISKEMGAAKNGQAILELKGVRNGKFIPPSFPPVPSPPNQTRQCVTKSPVKNSHN